MDGIFVEEPYGVIVRQNGHAVKTEVVPIGDEPWEDYLDRVAWEVAKQRGFTGSIHSAIRGFIDHRKDIVARDDRWGQLNRRVDTDAFVKDWYKLTPHQRDMLFLWWNELDGSETDSEGNWYGRIKRRGEHETE